jgi:hypothetical protein
VFLDVFLDLIAVAVQKPTTPLNDTSLAPKQPLQPKYLNKFIKANLST